MFHRAVQISGEQTQVLETVFLETLCALRVGFGSVRKNFDKAIARDMQVKQHQRTVVMVEPKRFVDAEFGIKRECALDVVCGEGGVSYISYHDLFVLLNLEGLASLGAFLLGILWK